MQEKLAGIADILHVSSCLLFSTLLWNGERNLPVRDRPGHDGCSPSAEIFVEAETQDVGVDASTLAWRTTTPIAGSYPKALLAKADEATTPIGRAHTSMLDI
jgi:hypothetical protein